MIEPSLAFQTAIRAKLLATPAVTDLVPVDHIRAGSAKPDRIPSIILSNPQTEFLGYAAGSQTLCKVTIDLHVWALEDGPDTAKAIGWAVMQSLIGLKLAGDFAIDDFEQPRLIWLRDPQPELAYTHGIMPLEAVIRFATEG